MHKSAKANVDLRRGELLDAAAFLFATKGFHATGMRELAQHLTIKAGSLYYHISSKEQLLREVCEIGMEQLRLSVDEAVASSSGLGDTIRALVLGHARLIRRYGHFLRCYQNEYMNLPADAGEKMRRELSGFHRRIDDLLARAIESGECPATLDVKTARLVIISMFYQLSRVDQEGNQLLLDETARSISDILINGLATR